MATIAKKTVNKKGAINQAKAKNAKRAQKAKKPSVYQAQVLEVNRKLKTEQRTLGGCIKLILLFRSDIKLDATRVKVLRLFQKDKAAYESFKGIVRTSKSGNYSPFYVLQALNKNIEKFKK